MRNSTARLLRRVAALEASYQPKSHYSLVWDNNGELIPAAGPDVQQTGGIVYRRRIQYSQFPSQRKFDRLEHTFKGFSGPIGSGKSKALCFEAIKCAYRNPGVLGLIGAPTQKLLSASTAVELIATLEEQRIPFTYLKSASTIELREPESTILLRSMEQPERLRAMNLGWFGIDELTYCREAAWLRLEGRLRHPKAHFKCGFAAWTPRGRDWVWRRFISARRVPTCCAVLAEPFENQAVLAATPDFYEKLKHSYDEKLYRQEVLGEYLDLYSGAVYHAFSPERNVRPTDYDRELPLIWSLDFNVNPMTSILAQCRNGRISVLKEILLPASNTAEMTREFFRRTAQWAEQARGRLKVEVYGDASGGATSAASGGDSNWSIIQKLFASRPEYDARFLYPRSNPALVDRLNAVNALFSSFDERQHRRFDSARLSIDPGCRELLADLEEVNWKVDAHGNTYPELDKRDPKRTHVSDALGYYCAAEHSLTGQAVTVIPHAVFF
jgi:hypothetical protein